jgi:hypothetical protein
MKTFTWVILVIGLMAIASAMFQPSGEGATTQTTTPSTPAPGVGGF